ncbi:E3 ubiquitin-protein ligase RNF4 isoform X2 [Nematostella vectensis]|uniref:E3 ubiquitin-protein ligase RNF4 isoform X2 n=1 Tax=Nematostella vectensis TaxID=45351 RepID=UPI002076E542|nr:E3 ubiquitin-protein ligase RNF4 isoform X2 [Nematostella vectensis]
MLMQHQNRQCMSELDSSIILQYPLPATSYCAGIPGSSSAADDIDKSLEKPLSQQNPQIRHETKYQVPSQVQIKTGDEKEAYEKRFDDAMDSLLGNITSSCSTLGIPVSPNDSTCRQSTDTSISITTSSQAQDDITIVAEVQATQPEVIDLVSTPTIRRGSSFVVDLTSEPSSPDRDVVDLTRESVSDTPVIVCVSRIFQRAPSLTWQRPSCMFASYSGEVSPTQLSDDDVQDVTNDQASNAPSRSRDTSADDKNARKTITCPICMDDDEAIKKRKRQLTSTVCGHVFCDKCIKNAVKIQKKCPTCRKDLTLRQLHPIFL